MKKTILLTLTSCALFNLAPNAPAAPTKNTKHRAARIAWCAADVAAPVRTAPVDAQPQRVKTAEDDAGLFRSTAERTMANPG